MENYFIRANVRPKDGKDARAFARKCACVCVWCMYV